MSPCKGAGQQQVKRAPRKAAALTLHHTPVGGVCDGVDVRGHLVPLLALIHVHNLFRVDGQVLVRIDDHTEQARIGLERRAANGSGLGSVILSGVQTGGEDLLPPRPPGQPDGKALPGGPRRSDAIRTCRAPRPAAPWGHQPISLSLGESPPSAAGQRQALPVDERVPRARSVASFTECRSSVTELGSRDKKRCLSSSDAQREKRSAAASKLSRNTNYSAPKESQRTSSLHPPGTVLLDQPDLLWASRP